MRRARPLLGTLVEIGVTEHTASQFGQAYVRSAIQKAFDRIEFLQHTLSFHDPASELNQLNCHPGQWLSLSRSTMRVLRLARAMMQRSQLAFNCTCGGTLVVNGKLPNPFKNDETPFLPAGDASDIEFCNNLVRLRRPVLITLDGIAKGFAVDEAIKSLKSDKLPGAWVNAGGDLRIFGNASLAVTLRSDSAHRTLGQFSNCAVASSRTTNSDDPRFAAYIVGLIENGSTQGDTPVSIKAVSAWKADALTKVVACLNTHESQKILQRCDAKLVTSA